jgi:citrate synthase
VTELLDISMGTLYSYVSRGLIRSEESSDDTRRRRYRSEDVAQLQQRKERRHNPAVVAESAFYWGDPVLESAITLIENERPYYRGSDVLKLAEEQIFEAVTYLLWTGSLPQDSRAVDGGVLPERLLQRGSELKPTLSRLPPVDAFQCLLPVLATEDLAAHDLTPNGVMRTGGRIIRLLMWLVTGALNDQPIAQQLAQHWTPNCPSAEQLFNAALILCADHELNASSFVVRCVVSTGATPYAGVQAGLAALQGPHHCGDALRMERFLADARADPREAIAQRVKQGERLPGFIHQLYPNGDPRARLLLTLLQNAMPANVNVRLAEQLSAEVQSHFSTYPILDFALVVLQMAMDLPSGSSSLLFALGRIAGWVAHMIEQYASGRLIRPRARYVGKAVGEQLVAKDM